MRLTYEELLEKCKQALLDIMDEGKSFEEAIKELLYIISKIAIIPLPTQKLIEDLEKWYYGIKHE